LPPKEHRHELASVAPFDAITLNLADLWVEEEENGPPATDADRA
jgi:hypothetical protein